MKFHFRLETLMRHRKLVRDEAQREYMEAQNAVQAQLARIKEMYSELDGARLQAESTQQRGGSCSPELTQIEEYVEGQKIRIQMARQKARELMQVSEEKQDVLIEKMRVHKTLEKLKEKQKEDHRKQTNKREQAKADDTVLMRYDPKERL